ncbi:restriction endonuclease [Cellulosimicrobium cellulans]|uniref:restriction endonuclease n=1 Tax=Cellulosimicrobium cellulans TaxID=1710 RepID=UPI001963932F|nr:restriction endonuclease [Cellulosimicrobium cellulans]MBN0040563.1 restriction endonuclease [Cellulosimicrobium cellulans]
MATAWVVRSGKYGERDQWAIENGVSGGGWREVPDLSPCRSRQDVAAVIADTFPELGAPAQANYTGQTWALRGRIRVGDLLVMPLKTTKQIAMGQVTGGYEYRSHETDPEKRHVVRVDWKVTDLPRSAVKQDLLYTLGSALSVFAPTKGHAVERLRALLARGEDPGQLPFVPVARGAGGSSRDTDDVDEPELHTDIVEVARDRITARIAEEFAGHDLAALVTAVLEAEGFVCTMSPPGADRGIDIVAGRGLLGMESPRTIVQVKSGGQISEMVVRDLNGVIHAQGAEQGLLVAWGGLTKPARDAVYGQQFRIRVWTAEDLIDAVTRVYDDLPEDIRARLPLKQVWMLAE